MCIYFLFDGKKCDDLIEVFEDIIVCHFRLAYYKVSQPKNMKFSQYQTLYSLNSVAKLQKVTSLQVSGISLNKDVV